MFAVKSSNQTRIAVHQTRMKGEITSQDSPRTLIHASQTFRKSGGRGLWRHLHLLHSLFDLHQTSCARRLRLLQLVARTVIAFAVSAFKARIFGISVDVLAFVTSPSRGQRSRSRRGSWSRCSCQLLSPGIKYARYVRISGTLSTAFMLASLALRALALALEWCLALVAQLSRPLRDWLFYIACLTCPCCFFSLDPFFLTGIPRAFPAAGVVTTDTGLVDAILRLASVTGSVDPHADLLLYAGNIHLERLGPLSHFQCHVVLCKHRFHPILLDLGVFRRRGC